MEGWICRRRMLREKSLVMSVHGSQSRGGGVGGGGGWVRRTMRSKGRMKQRFASSSVGAQSHLSRLDLRSLKRL